MPISTTTADPSWQSRLRQRDAVLWLGPSLIGSDSKTEQLTVMQDLLHRTWNSVYCDVAAALDPQVASMQSPSRELNLRFFVDEAGAEHLPPNRLPIYWLRGPKGKAGPGSTEDPAALLNRMTMLKRASGHREVFVLGVSKEQDLAGLIEAAHLNEAFRQLVIVSPVEVNLQKLVGVTTRLFHWRTDYESFRQFVQESADRDSAAAKTTLLVRIPSGRTEVDFSHCIDQSHPITDAFEVIPSDEIIQERTPTVEDVKAFLQDPTNSWLPYAAGVPIPRHPEYERAILKYLKRFEHEGPSLTCTAWIPSEDGGGATTALRQLAFNIAREGFPVLLARPGLNLLDFRQLTAFLSSAAARISDAAISPSELPWVIAFDAQHTQLLWESMLGLANGLKNLLRSVVVLAVQTLPPGAVLQQAQGANRKLGDTLESNVTVEQGLVVGQHLSKFLPVAATRSESEWRWFISDVARPGVEGSHSLFWVALHFWLLRVPGTDESLRNWLASKLRAIVDGNLDRYRALLEIAVLGKHRLPTPLTLLTEAEAKSIVSDTSVLSSPLGLRRLTGRSTTTYSYAHPLIAEEILRIAESDNEAVKAIGMSTCFNLLDLELHLLGGILSRPAAGTSTCLPIVEELVTSALRVDPREAPRTYQVRDRVVSILEQASPAVWDSSQVFNHHMAKARRHLAVDPPDGRWTAEMRREQLELAEDHLNDALHNIQPPNDSHRESQLNLFVSMALTMDVRSRLEESEGANELANQFKKRSEEYYLNAQAIDADNTYVLENFARHKLRIARSLPASEERLRLVVEAISLLELERQSDDLGRREYATTEELANAYALFDDVQSQQQLGKMAAMGSESALVALAKLALRRTLEDPGAEEKLLDEAEMYLTRVPGDKRTWRSTLPLYQVVSRRSPLDFNRRIELLDDLDAAAAFAWPQQLRLEYGILLFQVGDVRGRQRGAGVYKALRDEMPSRASAVRVPRELKFLRDPRTGFAKALRTFIVVKNISGVGRSSYGIPDGWGTVDVVFRAYLFGRD